MNEIINLGSQDITNPLSNVIKKDFAKYWERDHINRCLDNITNPKHRTMFMLMWFTGARVSEITNIKKGDIDFGNYTITLKWLKSRKYNYRNIPMHPTIRDILNVFVAGLKSDDKLFGYTRQRVWVLSNKYFKGHPHQFRHSFSVNWLRCNGTITDLCKMLGHSNIRTTMEYLKIVPSDLGKELIKVQFR